jgi:hypothetical protein
MGDYFTEHGDDLIPVKLIDLCGAVVRMRQVQREEGTGHLSIIHERIFTCDLPRLEAYLPDEARRENAEMLESEWRTPS